MEDEESYKLWAGTVHKKYTDEAVRPVKTGQEGITKTGTDKDQTW